MGAGMVTDQGRRLIKAPPDGSARWRPSPITWLALLTAALPLLALFAASFGLRLYCLDCHGFWGDEISSLDGATLGIPAIFNNRFGYLGNQTPFHYLLLWLTMQPVDPATTTLLVRLPSALAGGMTPLLVYGIGREIFGRVQGMLAASLVALSVVHLNHSQELRLYAMLTFFTALSVYCLLLAERTGQGKWWVAFTLATVANLLNAYVALSLALPALLPYLAWVLFRLWSRRKASRRAALYGSLAMITVAAGALLTGLDMLHTPHPSPDLHGLSPGALVSSIVEISTWLTRFGIGDSLERPVQILMLLTAIVGFYSAIQRHALRGAFLCALFVVVPPLILALLSTTNVVFQRYALFAMPFYFLLMANGLLLPFSSGKLKASASRRKSLLVLNSVPFTLVLLVFGAGVYNYFSVDGHATVAYRPDFRGAAAYLEAHTRRDDLVIFLDDPALGNTITNFYWHSKPPSPSYDARDPRLFSQVPHGDIYYVVSFENRNMLSALGANVGAAKPVASFERVIVLHDPRPRAVALSISPILTLLHKLQPDAQPVKTLVGSLVQSRGDASVDGAVAAYRAAGTYFPVGDDYLRTAEGYAALGDNTKAWREALISKFWQPQRPEVHNWMAKMMSQAAMPTESRIEAAIAGKLQRDP
ncbi:MAG: glycosyltransferase family 39 protein [Chloroflexota bacterium]|nr:glycosyltransferase family 39 protein [Chloroflexota bacterium]